MKEAIEAGLRFLSRFDRAFPVRVAFWMKESDGPWWYLYIVSDAINDENFDRAYEAVIRLANDMQDPDFDPMRVKVRGPDDPVARAVLTMLQQHRGKIYRHLRDVVFGGVSAEEVYMYPQPVVVPAA